MRTTNPTGAHNLRLQRAWTHIKEFKRLVEDWSNGQPAPFIIVAESYPNQSLHLLRPKFQKELPPTLGLIAGDAVHNMRAALDNLMTDLVGKEFKGRTSFPILMTGGRTALLTRPGFDRLPTRIIDVLDKVQPYNAPNPKVRKGHYLFLLDQLWNFDKHRQMSFFGFSTGQEWVSYEEGTNVQLFLRRNRRVNDGDVIARITTAEGTEPKYHPNLAIDIAFDGGPAANLGAEQVLINCHYRVRQIFEEIFPAFTFEFPPID